MEQQEDDSVITNIRFGQKKKPLPNLNQRENVEDQKVLSQEELKAWWPFKRLDPKRMPRKVPTNHDYEDALL
jgi:hypothetical protein